MKKFFFYLLIVIASLTVNLSIRSEEVEEYGFITWYEIYFEAEEFMKVGKWKDAIDNYNLVLVKQSKDRRNARTYGMNFITKFTPNRDLGIAYYHIGEFELAKKYLEISYRQFPTDLTKEYFEKVKIELEKDILAEERLKKGIAHFEKREYELAINEMEEVLKIRPDNDLARKYKDRIESLLRIINGKKKIKK